eukprot:COSAG06_NODE_2387_length_6967_cov_99.192046_3_plen_91_part_00
MIILPSQARDKHRERALKKRSRVFLQHGSWPIANREMYSALSYAGYAAHLEWGKGCHSGRHIASVLPDALRWLWSTAANPPGQALAEPKL